MKSSVTFLGHRVDADGLHPLAEKVEVVVKAPTPRIKSQRAQVLLRTVVVLQQIPPKPVIGSCPSVPFTP